MAEELSVCPVCGWPVDRDTKCTVCGRPLCPYDIRVLEGYGTLCPRCFEDLSFQYHSKKCDVLR